jgi:hypothetical protein
MMAADAWQLSYWSAQAFGWFVVPFINFTIDALWVFRPDSILSLQRDEKRRKNR